MDSEIVACLKLSVSDNPQAVKKAGEALDALTKSEPHKLVAALCQFLSSDEDDACMRLSAAVLTKNIVKTRWVEWTAEAVAGPADVLKASILDLIFKNPSPQVKQYLLEVLATIAENPFPLDWPKPLSVLDIYDKFLASRGDSVALSDAVTAIQILSSCLAKYELATDTENVLTQLKFILDNSQEYLFAMFKFCSEGYCTFCESNGTALEQGKALSLATAESLRIIQFLHGVDLPEFFEDNLLQLMTEIVKLLQAPVCPQIRLNDDPSAAALGNEIKTIACTLIHLYTSKYMDVFTPFVPDTIATVVKAAEGCANNDSSQDALFQAALRCISTVSRTALGPDADPYLKIPNFFDRVLKGILIPNSSLNSDDLETAEEDPLTFVRQEVISSRRREAITELIQNVRLRRGPQLIIRLVPVIAEMISASNNPAAPNLLLKEAATYLVTAVSAKARSAARGIVEVTDATTVMHYFETELLPILAEPTAADCNRLSLEQQVVCASSLNFIGDFRNFFPPEVNKQLLSAILKFAACSSVMLHSAATGTLERLLVLKPDQTAYLIFDDPAVLRMLDQILTSLMPVVLKSLDDGGNEFVMRCVWRLLPFSQASEEVNARRLKELIELSASDSLRSSNPVFAHYLFEGIAVLTHIVVSKKKLTGGSENLMDLQQTLGIHKYIIEAMLATIVSAESHSFAQYAYQILTCVTQTSPLTKELQTDKNSNLTQETLMELRAIYVNLLRGVLKKERWTISLANISGILNLLRTLVERQWLFAAKDFLEQLPALLDGFCLSISQPKMDPALPCDYANDILYYTDPSCLPQFAPALIQILHQKCTQAIKANNEKDARKTLISIYAIMLRAEYLSRTLPNLPNPLADFKIEGFVEKLAATFDDICLINHRVCCSTASPNDIYLLITANGYLLTVQQTLRSPIYLKMCLEAVTQLCGFFNVALENRRSKPRTESFIPLEESEAAICTQKSGIDQGSTFNKLATGRKSAQHSCLDNLTNEVIIGSIFTQVASHPSVMDMADGERHIVAALTVLRSAGCAADGQKTNRAA